MEFKGTKGKWDIEYSNRDNSYDIYNESKEEFVCTTMNSLDINKYNALLISKSPEILKELVNEVEILKAMGLGDTERCKRKEQLIKQATEL